MESIFPRNGERIRLLFLLYENKFMAETINRPNAILCIRFVFFLAVFVGVIFNLLFIYKVIT